MEEHYDTGPEEEVCNGIGVGVGVDHNRGCAVAVTG